MTLRTCLMTVVIVLLVSCLSGEPIDPGKAKKGEDLFVRRCTGCHGLDEVRVGPRLRNVYGRLAGMESGFPYSDSLKASRIKWDETLLDKWLTDTEALVPDNNMSFRVSNAEERSAIIAYLKSLSGNTAR